MAESEDVTMMTGPRPRGVILGLFLMTGLAACRSQLSDASYDQGQAESEIQKMEHEWAQVAVTGDPAVMERIFADDFLGVTPEGVQYTKRGFIDDTKANPLGFTSNEVNEMKIRFFENVAVAQGDETFTRKSGEQGRFVWTDVLVRRVGEWRIVAAQDVVAPAAGHATSSALFQGADQSADARREIARTREAYVTAWEKGNAAQIAALYTDDALVLYPNQPAVSGRGAIVEYFRGFFGDFPTSEFALASVELVTNGQWAFDRGSYRWKGVPRAGGRPEEDNGKYLVILQRQADGTWKVARDMDNSDRLASQATRGTR
jgi:uncharacterized protein (TIGR02246 family)